MFTRAMVFAATCGALTFGCGTDQPGDSADEQQEIIDNLVQAGFPANDIRVVDGTVYVGNDGAVNLQASREMVQPDPSSDGKEQFRTTNLVASNGAIANYNALGLSFHMTRTTGSTTGCSATITARLSSGTGGSSGFPSGGRPFNAINIGTGLQTGFAVSTITHVMTHELGHTIGFRHSDFFNRAISCGGAASNEGTAGVGAILVPGTPSTAVVGGSIMNSCFRTTETGRFTSSDITALNALY